MCVCVLLRGFPGPSFCLPRPARARNAAIVAPLVLFAATIPALALPEGTSLGTKLILSLLSPAAYSWGMEARLLLDSEDPGGGVRTLGG